MTKENAVALIKFSKEVDKEIEFMMDTEPKDMRTDFTTSFNGVSLKLNMHADMYSNFDAFLMKSIADEATEYLEFDKLDALATYQLHYVNKYGETKVPNHFITFEAFGKTIYHPALSPERETNVDPEDYYGKHFLRSGWITESDDLAKKWYETALYVCEHDDSNGDYRESSFEEILQHFIYTVCHDIVEYREFFDSLAESVDYIKSLGHYGDALELLDLLSRTTDMDQALADIYEYGIGGFVNGTYTIKVQTPNKIGIIGVVGSGKQVMQALKLALEAEENGKKDMGKS